MGQVFRCSLCHYMVPFVGDSYDASFARIVAMGRAMFRQYCITIFNRHHYCNSYEFSIVYRNGCLLRCQDDFQIELGHHTIFVLRVTR